jgi:CIC family chloride channel protein
MSAEQKPDTGTASRFGSLLVLAVLALIGGAISGLVAVAFRFSLDFADRMRGLLVAWAHGWRFGGFLLLVSTIAAATAAAAWLVRRFSPHATGSGIPHVEAVLNGELPPATFHVIPVKFFGGALAIGSGLALGREGPSVQMGAILALFTGKIFRRSWSDCRVLLAAGAGAGLATAFNAPIAGAVFVLEELVRCFEMRIAVAALGASATSILVTRLFLGSVPDFHVEPLLYSSAETIPLFLAMGLLIGFAAVAYNRAIVGALAATDRLRRLPVEVRAALIGAAVGILAWYEPVLVGGGDRITQLTLTGGATILWLMVVSLLRFGLGAASYAARTPGGLFAPLLVVGAQLGLITGTVCNIWFPSLGIQPEAFAVVGMAAFFTGVVRAPITGIVLITEMTASFQMLLPMLGACITAMLLPTLMRNAPIYDSLRVRTSLEDKGGMEEVRRRRVRTFRAGIRKFLRSIATINIIKRRPVMSIPSQPLGKSGMRITRVGFGSWAVGGGGWSFGWGPQKDAESLAAMRHAIGLGVNWIDTAAVYGLGHSEEIVGVLLKELPAADRPFIFTKCGLVWDEHRPMSPPKRVLKPDSIRRECEASLRRLGVERIDLYQFHWPDDTGTPVEDSWAAMIKLVEEGKVRAVGVSNFNTDLLGRCESVRHIDSLQPPFSMINRSAAVKDIPWCAGHETGVICYSPMQSGLLTDSFTAERVKSFPEDDWRRMAPQFKEPELSRNLALRDALRPIAERHGASTSAVSVAWVLAWPGVTGAIVGARRPEQVDGWIKAASIRLTDQDLSEIEAAIKRTGAGAGPTAPPSGGKQ